MNGLLTALLGGAAGAAEGVEANRQFAFKQQQQQLERSRLLADLYLQGLEQIPDGGGPGVPQPHVSTPIISAAPVSPAAMPPAPTGLPQQAPGPRGVLTQVMSGGARTKDGVLGPPPSPDLTSTSVPLSDMSAGPTPTAPGGVRAVDVVRNVASGSAAPDLPITVQRLAANDGQTITLPGVGSFRYNFSRSPAARELTLKQYEAYANKSAENQAAIDMADRKARAAVAAQQPDPRSGQPISYADAFNAALNGSLAWQPPIDGTPAGLAAKGADRRQQEVVNLDELIRGGPIRARNAALETDATTPGMVARAGQTAATTVGVNPPETQLRAAGALQSASHAKNVIDSYVQQFGAPGMKTQLAQRYPSLGNYLDSKEGQTLRNAAINFLDASMDASGQQRYNGSVLDQKIHALIPWAGDAPDVLQQKLQFLNDAMHSMAVNAGAALPRASGDPGSSGAVRGNNAGVWSKYGITPSRP